ncbi:MAG TPA: hypothetical protein DCP85_03405 [Elusimicrobia bacterium]|nr:hypothetical protein [Elusimicrobiota bacterium]
MPAHAAASAALSGAVFAATGSATMAVAATLSGIFIDLDHLADFLILSGEKFSIRAFFRWCEDMKWERIFLLLHSFELWSLAALLAFWLRNELLIGLTLGAAGHLILDQIGNRNLKNGRLCAWFYFLSYRCRVGFRRALLVHDPVA